ncbi:replication restart helicase PriA [Ekhidna sp.]|uniref:replication restart helicase PriA n=1 Tax=Ekhidna sp. TaxID=2608089 RepID=UPI003B511BD1
MVSDGNPYCEIILPLPLSGTFTYFISPADRNHIFPGSRVVVSFGKKKIYTGIVLQIHNHTPEEYRPKEVLEILDEQPIVNDQQLKFFQWMSRYYMCSLGEVINAALPAALKLSSESFVGINPEIDVNSEDLEDREWQLLKALKTNDLTMKDVSEVLGLKQPQKVLKKLSEGGLIDLFEKVKDKYQPKKVKRLRISEVYLDDGMLEGLINELESKPKQQDVLLAYLREIPVLDSPESNVRGITKSSLITQNISASSVKTLIKNNVLIEWEEIVSRLPSDTSKIQGKVSLSQVQESTKRAIIQSFETHNAVLLHGVTGSGKTEIFIELIKEQLETDKQVLYLLPEIALTTQIIARLHKIFGDSFGVYHSRYSDNERVEVWKKVLNNEFRFVVGVRSAVFLPFSNLGLIIVDEEHEPSYKQFEPAPRYHARDAAIYLSTVHHANTLLGTATPALETYQNALDDKYGLVELTSRYGEAYHPKMEFANVNRERKQRKLKGNFTSTLLEAIQESLDKKEQVILFQNRRGYASYITCDNCSTIPKCPNCSVSLTYHQYNNKLVCHYCGYNQSMYSDCLSCGSKELRNVGFGTEELEEEIKLMFPQAIVQRMDLDTTRSKYGYQRIIEEFEDGDIDILVGTQMVSKGLDFDRVNLVGIFDTDRMIHFPDFRSHERAYNLITQVSGRAGRKSKDGKVIVQTNDPDQELLQRVRNGDYLSFFQWEINERERFYYPPFTRIIQTTFKHREKVVSFQAASYFAKEVRNHLGNQRMIGPVEPIIGKIRNMYLHEVTLKIEKQGINLPAVKEYLRSVEMMMKQMPAFKSVGVVFDVDPV